MKSSNAVRFLAGLSFGEGLRWRDGRLWWSDFYLQRISSAAPDGTTHIEVSCEDQPSGLGWLPDGRLLFVAMTHQRLMRREHDGRIAQHADLSHLARHHANDMFVDRYGNAFVGSFGFDLDSYTAEHGAAALYADPGPPRAPLVRVDAQGNASIAATDLRFPNGTVLLPDGRTLVVAETFRPSLTAFDLGDNGALTNRRLWASLPTGAAPDGICADADGAIWCANANAPECLRVAAGGDVLERVATSMNAFCCVLGGHDSRTLYIATARADAATGKVIGQIESAQVSISAARAWS